MVNVGVMKSPEERFKQLLEVANRVDVSCGLTIQQYLRAMRSMVNMVDNHIQGDRKEQAYKLAMKFSILYLEQLPRHPEYRLLTGPEKDIWDKRAHMMLTKAEHLKAELQNIYLADYKKYQEELQQAESAAQKAAEEAAKGVSNTATPAPLPLAVSSTVTPVSPVPSPKPLPTYPGDIDGVNRKPTQLTSPETSSLQVPPTVNRSLKPIVAQNPYEWAPLRMSVQNVIDSFLRLSSRNTKENRETCASLCGRIVNDEFHLTDMVFLKQSGTSDSCTTYKEEELFEYAEKKCLIELGWIHTHPTQTAFLSSVDQHCQLSYQIMLPEAVAIVCAPKYEEVKIFSLTPDYGIPTIRNCREVGFHQHPKLKPIFEESRHVIDDASISLTVVDLR